MEQRTYTIQKDKSIIAEGEEVWLGIDVHKKNSDITFVDREQVIYRTTIPTERKHFEALLQRLPDCYVRAVYEAGPTGYNVLRWLREAGAEAMITPPSMVPSRSGTFVKTDQRDSLELATLHRAKTLVEAWDLTDVQYEERELVRTRKQLVEARADFYRQIRSKLLFHGCETPENDGWSNAFLEWLEDSPTGRTCIDAGLHAITQSVRALTHEIRELNALIAELAETPGYRELVEILVSIPGVGLITAMTFLTELGDLSRFRTAEQFSSFVGLVPSEHSSGDRRRRGGLPRKGNARVRSVLVQSAWILKNKDPRMGEVYERIRRRNGERGSQIAIVAVARRLGLAMRAMLRDATPYECKQADVQAA